MLFRSTLDGFVDVVAAAASAGDGDVGVSPSVTDDDTATAFALNAAIANTGLRFFANLDRNLALRSFSSASFSALVVLVEDDNFDNGDDDGTVVVFV